MNSEVEKLEAEIARLMAEIDSRDAEMDDERRAMMFMLEDTNRSTEEMEKALKDLTEEKEVTDHLLMISEATAHTTDIDKLMEKVVHCSHNIIGCDICLSYLWDRVSRVFRPSRAQGLEHGVVGVFMTALLDEKTGLVKRALGGMEQVITLSSPSLVKEWGGDAAFSWLPEIKSLVAIPLTGKLGPLGVIVGIYVRTTPHLHPLPLRGEETKGVPEGEGKTPAPSRGGMGRGWGEGGFEFTERDEKVMAGIANQVSIALEQARLYKESVDKGMELSHKIETIQVMHEIDRSILSTLDPQTIIETTVRMVSRVIPCDATAVLLVDMEREGFIYAAGFGLPYVTEGVFIPFTDTMAAEVIKTARTQYVPNLVETQNIASLPALEDGLLKEGFLSQIRLPLIAKEEVVGILTVEAKRAAAFTPEDLATLEKVAYQIGVALQNARQLKDLEELFMGTVKSLSAAIDAKSPWTAGHSERVTRCAVQIGREMGLSEKELKDLELAGLLHDVGKIGTYEAILDKPARLTDEEQAMMRQHPAKGAEILAPIKQLKDIIPAIKYHQEFYDGTGYPEGIKGEEIPLFARIIGVADTVDAMGADRPYRKGKPMDVIIAELKRCSGTQFDPKVVEGFLKIVETQHIASVHKMAAS